VPPACACGVAKVLSSQNEALISEERSPSYIGLETSRSTGDAACQNWNDSSGLSDHALNSPKRCDCYAGPGFSCRVPLSHATNNQIASQPRRLGKGCPPVFLFLGIKPGGIYRTSHISARCDWYLGWRSFFKKVGAQSHHLLPTLIASFLGLRVLLSPSAEMGERGWRGGALCSKFLLTRGSKPDVL
jgi:hypothetical protein